MAHFAKLGLNNIVEEVVFIKNIDTCFEKWIPKKRYTMEAI